MRVADEDHTVFSCERSTAAKGLTHCGPDVRRSSRRVECHSYLARLLFCAMNAAGRMLRGIEAWISEHIEPVVLPPPKLFASPNLRFVTSASATTFIAANVQLACMMSRIDLALAWLLSMPLQGSASNVRKRIARGP